MTRLTPLAPLLLVALTGCGDGGGGQGGPAGPHPSLERLARPLIVGHGGAKRLCAENTLPCFAMALDLGPDQVTAGTVSWCHEHDHVITASTVDETAELASVLEEHAALDGIVTNRPDRLQMLLERRSRV